MALYRCIEVPYKVEEKAYNLWPYIKQLVAIFNLETKSDLQVAVKCLETGIFGAYANVSINMKSFDANDEKV
jgi:glutamate formiminotransferase/formiminotetrahydrofolate cyclodeaminase